MSKGGEGGQRWTRELGDPWAAESIESTPFPSLSTPALKTPHQPSLPQYSTIFSAFFVHTMLFFGKGFPLRKCLRNSGLHFFRKETRVLEKSWRNIAGHGEVIAT